jgi:hypothetical protein
VFAPGAQEFDLVVFLGDWVLPVQSLRRFQFDGGVDIVRRVDGGGDCRNHERRRECDDGHREECSFRKSNINYIIYFFETHRRIRTAAAHQRGFRPARLLLIGAIYQRDCNCGSQSSQISSRVGLLD